MGDEREIRGVRWLLMFVLVFLTTALSFELLSESYQARLDAAWRARRHKFEVFRHTKEQELARHLAAHVTVPGYQIITELDAIPRELRGLHPDNPVNRVRGGGAQLELSSRVRGISPRSGLPGDDGLAPATSALVQGLAAAARSWDVR